MRTNKKGEAYYLCPKCNKLYKVVGITKTIPNYVFVSVDENGNPPGYFDADFNIKCLCNNDFRCRLVDIDPNIAREIVILNRKGYKTHFCCEGHGMKDNPDFYVAFTIPKVRFEEIINTITFPKDWEMKYGKFSCSIKKGFCKAILRVSMKTYFEKFEYDDEEENSFSYDNPISDEEYIKIHRRHLREFKEIVKSLPNLTGEKLNNRVSIIQYDVKLIGE